MTQTEREGEGVTKMDETDKRKGKRKYAKEEKEGAEGGGRLVRGAGPRLLSHAICMTVSSCFNF